MKRRLLRWAAAAPWTAWAIACALPFCDARSGATAAGSASIARGAAHVIAPDVHDGEQRVAPGWESLLAPIDGAVAEAIQTRKTPGCVVVIGRRDEVIFRRAYGLRAREPIAVPMTLDTVFDLASLTKPLATAASVMVLADRGVVGIDEPVAQYVPGFGRKGKSRITVRQLLTHTAGLPADTPVKDYELGRDEALRRIYDLTPRGRPGDRFAYSDVGYDVLEEVVRRASGEDLAAFAQKNLYEPLGMRETSFLPGVPLRARAAPTEFRVNAWMQGEVHDPRAFLMGGVSGHAGRFSTADDVARFAQAMLRRGGTPGGASVLSPKGAADFMAPHDVPGAVRALGWDVRSPFSTNRGDGFSPRAVGHGGYTGTALWIDPELDLFVLFLSNRVHPDGKGSVNPLVKQIGTLAATAVDRHDNAEKVARAAGEVRTGVDVLRAEGFRALRGAHVGLITNRSGVARDGAMTIEVLGKAAGLELVAIFSPEHGLMAQHEGKIEHGADDVTGLPIYSLYGETLKPTPAMLKGIDTLVFDIQDVGTRYFTYASTMRRAMEAAVENGLRFVVLDRPNPLGGGVAMGPILQANPASFVNHHPLPVRHGMTMGELAELFNADLHLGADLRVVRVEGWRREDDWDATGLAWVNPSPNLRNVSEVVLYPATGLLESTNVSVGRGTATPFEVLGAPWIDGAALADGLARQGLAGVSFDAVDFTPDTSLYAHEECHGVRLTVTVRSTFDPIRTAFALARELATRHPGEWHLDDMGKMIGHKKVMEALATGKTVDEIASLWSDDLALFQKKREKYLLYPPSAR